MKGAHINDDSNNNNQLFIWFFKSAMASYENSTS